MKKVYFIISLVMLFCSQKVFADRFVPEFDKMKTLKCNVEENIYDTSGKKLVHNLIVRTYKLDDENSKIYLEKAPVDKILNYDENNIEFRMQNMTDDFIIQSNVKINRLDNTISSDSTIQYDSIIYEKKFSKAIGVCVYL